MKLSIVENGKQRENSVDFSRFAKELKKNAWKIALAGIIAGVVAYPLISMMSSKYVSTATVLIKAQADNVSPFPQVDGFDSTRSGYYETQYALMQSRIILEQAVRDLKLDENPDFTGVKPGSGSEDQQLRVDQALKTLSKDLKVIGIRTTNLASISYESSSPQLSAEIANGVAQAFINYTVEQKRLKAEQARNLNFEKMEEIQKSIAKQKEEMDSYLKNSGLLTFRGIDGFETEQLSIVTNRLADATQRRVAAESVYNEVNSRGKSSGDIISLPSVSDHAQIQDLRIALIQAQRTLSELRKVYGPKSANILKAEADVQSIQNQTGRVLGELKLGLRQQYLAALADEKNYQQQVAEQKEIFQKMASKRDAWNSQKLALDKMEDLYKTLYQRTQELSLSGVNADAVLYDPAVPPLKPSKPNKSLLLVMVVMLVVVFSIMYFIVKAAMDNSISTLSRLKKRLNVEPLGEIRRFTGTSGRAQVRDMILKNPLNADIIHGIRTRIILDNRSLQTVAITSAEQGEGRSLLANLLASSFSFDQKTLLIDADFFNTNGLSSELASATSAGVAELLRGEAPLEKVRVKIAENLDFIPHGKTTISSLLMLSSERVEPVMRELKSQYQRIIIDVAAVNQSQDIQLIKRAVDGVIFIVKAGTGSAENIASALDKIEDNQGVVIGAVLNAVEEKNLETQEGLRSLNFNTDQLMTTPGRV
ncbi:TPA: polysaccharide biosynthesis tyrosine autokinase [Citrobacter youngae]|uniref:GumC family protein n=1 Tax=Citrobacter sp. FDAARGOS_156 TaxID=1702170 RepID=UPI0019011E1C|nr:polysaccharide biosynthesis tyrosine autokinase [Citrobacter sp. FDAARGOS_156]HEE0141967.1 polysaccharide biosynthesis tyrosine autokinase [Citrobacter youngae]MBJ9557939.1 polysaccharide biosynthesis tyrosine autokinase [Citrobacter sp. FDAARGOS_156]HEF0072318.1 polysaccharide biosynthesis tyrosine autokinase [Citrobacter youngae]HEF0086726.1 polysaccharide biosynthesis tyrosine autokinase [Citrobacter youngae]HEF0095756.1 polysaccharide biosynthesis tyrosine autokinase [Citrobacter younga